MTNIKTSIDDYLRHICESAFRCLVAVCVAVSSLAASAYLAPVEERCGVRVEIGSFPQKTERPGKNPYAWPLGVTEDFGGVKTDGAFRLADWMITPLPHSKTFSAEIDLAAFGAAGRTVAGVDAVDPEDGAAAPTWSQTGNVLKIACDAKSFAYRIRLRGFRGREGR